MRRWLHIEAEELKEGVGPISAEKVNTGDRDESGKPPERDASIAGHAETRYRKALLIGHYGGANTGDEAMLVSLLHALPKSLAIDIVAKNDAALPLDGREDIRAIGMGAIAVLKAAWSADIVILGGGTHFHDDYLGARLLRHYRYMARYVAVFCISKMLRKRVFFLGMGIGPLRRWPSRLIARCAFALADGISVRDQASLEEASALGAGKKTLRAFDLTALKFADQITSAKPSNPLWLAVSLTDIPGSESKLVGRMRLVETLAGGLGQLLATRHDVCVKVVVIRGGERESDIELSQLLVEALSKYRDRVKLHPYSHDPEDCAREFRSSYAACVMRYHAGLLAYLAGCRLLLLPYHRKLVDLGCELGLSPSACPPLHSLTASVLAKHLSELISAESAEYAATLPIRTARELALRNILVMDL